MEPSGVQPVDRPQDELPPPVTIRTTPTVLLRLTLAMVVLAIWLPISGLVWGFSVSAVLLPIFVIAGLVLSGPYSVTIRPYTLIVRELGLERRFELDRVRAKATRGWIRLKVSDSVLPLRNYVVWAWPGRDRAEVVRVLRERRLL